MRILVINTVRFQLNGITSVIMNYYRWMDKSRMIMDFVTIGETNEGIREELKENGSKLYEFKRAKNPFYYMKSLTRLLREQQYDVVHVHGNSALMLVDLLPAKWAGVPVRIAHSHNTDCTNKLLHHLLEPVFRKTYNHGFACGEEAGKWLYGIGKFLVVRNGIDLQKFRFLPEVRMECRRKIGAGKRRVIGHVGHFTEQKNHRFLIDLFAELQKENPEILLLLLGDGMLMDEMVERAKENNVMEHVIFCGNVQDIPNYLMAMDLFVLPSIYEGMPLSLIEAQASGLPCIASDRISPEARLTDLMGFLPLEEEDRWKREILNNLDLECLGLEKESLEYRQSKSEEASRRIAEQGYEIKENASRLQSLYQAYIEEAKYGKCT